MSTAIQGSQPPQRRPIRILALDGGGVRGLSSLLILRELMQRLGVKRGVTASAPIRPSECFELIIGTGTGGISALLLGRMGLNIDEAINAYVRIANTAFKPSRRALGWLRQERVLLDGDILECVVGDIVEEFLKDRNARVGRPLSDGCPCRTIVLIANEANIDAPPDRLRSYDTRLPASDYSIREVARASAATAGIFPSALLGNPPAKFINAASAGYNNPAEVGMQEARTLWPGGKIGCLVSLGTGLQAIVPVGEGWDGIAQSCSSLVSSCEHVHDRVARQWREDGSYFRFNVDRGLDGANITRLTDAGSLEHLTGVTQGYMRLHQVEQKLDSCAHVLHSETPGNSIFASHLLHSCSFLHRSTYAWAR